MTTVTFKHTNESKPFAKFYATDNDSAMKIAKQVNFPGSRVQAHIEGK